jgi:hypothetical protein
LSTLPEEWEGLDTDVDFEPNAAESEYPAVVPVKVVFDETQRLPPGFTSFMTWPIGQVGVSPPTQALQRREHRFKAKFFLNFPAAGTITINSKMEPLTKDANPQGFAVTVTAAANNLAIPDYDGTQPLFFIASIAGCTVAVMDESFGQVQ